MLSFLILIYIGDHHRTTVDYRCTLCSVYGRCLCQASAASVLSMTKSCLPSSAIYRPYGNNLKPDYPHGLVYSHNLIARSGTFPSVWQTRPNSGIFPFNVLWVLTSGTFLMGSQGSKAHLKHTGSFNPKSNVSSKVWKTAKVAGRVCKAKSAKFILWLVHEKILSKEPVRFILWLSQRNKPRNELLVLKLHLIEVNIEFLLAE